MLFNIKTILAGSICAIAALALSSQASAGTVIYSPGISSFNVITSGSGPTDLGINGVSSNTLVDFVIEQKGVTLSKALAVDITANGQYDSGNLPPVGSIAANSVVNSYLLHTNPTATKKGGTIFTGNVTLPADETVIGVIVGSNRLDKSDFLGLANVTYPPDADNARGLELTAGEDGINLNGNTVTLNVFDTHGNVDEARILTTGGTGSPNVPEPASLAVLGVGATGLLLRRRNKA